MSKKKLENINMKGVVQGFINKTLNKNEDLTKRRSEICKVCPSNVKEPNEFFRVEDKIESISSRMCNECGCALYLKLRVENEKCPLGKW